MKVTAIQLNDIYEAPVSEGLYEKAAVPEKSPAGTIQVNDMKIEPVEIVTTAAKKRPIKTEQYTPKRVFKPLEVSEKEEAPQRKTEPTSSFSSYFTVPNVMLGFLVLGSLLLLGKPAPVEAPAPNYVPTSKRFLNV